MFTYIINNLLSQFVFKIIFFWSICRRHVFIHFISHNKFFISPKENNNTVILPKPYTAIVFELEKRGMPTKF